MEIIIGKTYNCFNDGKIKESRRHEVTITEIIPFDAIDNQIKQDWLDEVDQCDWLYSENTDYFIKGLLNITDETIEIVFVRTLDNDWFSLGYFGGELDETGELTKNLNIYESN